MADEHYFDYKSINWLRAFCLLLFSLSLSLFFKLKKNCSADEPLTFDDQSSSLIRLNNGTVLFLREINNFLALVCILRDYNFNRQGVIDFNFMCFRDSIHKVFEATNINQNDAPSTSYMHLNERHSPDFGNNELVDDGDNTDNASSHDNLDVEVERRRINAEDMPMISSFVNN